MRPTEGVTPGSRWVGRTALLPTAPPPLSTPCLEKGDSEEKDVWRGGGELEQWRHKCDLAGQRLLHLIDSLVCNFISQLAGVSSMICSREPSFCY